MQLSERAVLEFQELHLLKFDTEISEEEAEADLLKLMRLVAGIQPKMTVNQMQNEL